VRKEGLGKIRGRLAGWQMGKVQVGRGQIGKRGRLMRAKG